MGNVTKYAVWPDGDFCLLEEVSEFSHKSDDYEVATVGDVEHELYHPDFETFDSNNVELPF